MNENSTINFSIIIPVYKVEKYLRQCLDSVLRQSYRNFEAILVDDGSPDQSGTICDEYARKDSRFHVIHQLNQGVCVARKVGVQKAKGDYVCWVDGDDYVADCFLENIKKITDKHEPDVVAFGYKRVNDSGMVMYDGNNHMTSDMLYKLDDKFYSGLIYDRTMKKPNNGTLICGLWSKAIKREKIKDGMLAVPDQIRYGEDMAAVMLALCKSNTVYVSSLQDYFYRWNEASITNVIKKDDFERKKMLFRFLYGNMDKIPQINIDNYAFNQTLNHVTDNIWNYSDYKSYQKYIRQSITSDVQKIIDRTKLTQLPVKEYILSEFLKHYAFCGFWLTLRTKRQIVSWLKNLFGKKE